MKKIWGEIVSGLVLTMQILIIALVLFVSVDLIYYWKPILVWLTKPAC